MRSYLLANWKSHKTLAEAEAWLDKFARIHAPDPQLQVIIAPPAPFLVPLWQKIQKMNIADLALAVQDLSPFPPGSYTGGVAAAMVRGFAEYAILGHSERRRYFHETPQEIADKVSEAVEAGIKPIVCVDLPYAREQLNALDEKDSDGLIIGYGPAEAIGIETPQSFVKASEAIEAIRAMAPDKTILYGGSINKENAGKYINLPGISGLMVGTAGLDPEEFAAIGHALSRAGKPDRNWLS
ncbi:MAG: triose-phosphate isomerase [Desulfobulbaceae bacterium]|nr:triose-phosphate isomerase [Desulfobulbaceae bacterium]HIJ91275.1 triosephosphate isomerase [Deltaproteobacteria bacterium]